MNRTLRPAAASISRTCARSSISLTQLAPLSLLENTLQCPPLCRRYSGISGFSDVVEGFVPELPALLFVQQLVSASQQLIDDELGGVNVAFSDGEVAQQLLDGGGLEGLLEQPLQID